MRIVATVFGFVVLVLLLSGLNATLFQGAPEGSWRKRIPSIFLDVARFALIAVGLAMIFSLHLGRQRRRLFTALGITSIVLGLALQNSVGQIISGLLVLFEQPFQLGDWVDTPSARGRVVEVNWRATHIDTGSGLQIMPNSVLAAASFTNLSRPPGAHSHHRHDGVLGGRSARRRVHDADHGWQARCRTCGPTPRRRVRRPAELQYTTSIPLRSPADDVGREIDVPALGLVRLAARRAAPGRS